MERREIKKDLSTNMNHEAAMDGFLEKIGLFRKPIAKDGSCLFRAVAEQVFNCQAEHTRVRGECIEFMNKNKERFEAFVEGPFDHHLFNLRSQKQWAGQVEIQALSLMYKCDFLVYKDVNTGPIKATENSFEKKIILCYSNGNHYDSIFPHSYKSNLGFCQSIVFELLYGKVFPFLMEVHPEKKAINSNLVERNDQGCDGKLVNDQATGNKEENDGWTTVKSKKQGKTSIKNQKNAEQNSSDQSSPLSSKLYWEMMRSMDTENYRNIALEIWEQRKKEQQHKDQSIAASIQFRKNDRCQVRHPQDEKLYWAVIDDVLDEKCKIWIPELKERKVVSFSRLKPKEQHSNYRELSGYYRKQESNDETTRVSDDQKTNKRRKSNRNKKVETSETQQETSIQQEDGSGRQKGEKNRRRKSNNNFARAKDNRRDFNQIQNDVSQERGSYEVNAFPALPTKDEHPTPDKEGDECSNSNHDPAAFWRKRREVGQIEKTAELKRTVESKLDKIKDNVPHNDICKNDIVKNEAKSIVNESSKPSLENSTLHGISLDLSSSSIPGISSSIQEISSSTIEDSHKHKQESPEATTENHLDDDYEDNNHKFPDHGNRTKEEKKHVNWKDLQNNEDHHIVNDKIAQNKTEETNEMNKTVLTDEKAVLKDTVIEIEQENVAGNNSLNKIEFYENEENVNHQANFEVISNPINEDNQVESTPLTEKVLSFVGHDSGENIVENGTTVDYEEKEEQGSSTPHMSNYTSPNRNSPSFYNDHTGMETSNIDIQPIFAPTIHNGILNGNITYSRDIEGKDLPQDMEVVRYFYNYGIYAYRFFSGSVFPGNTPMSPVYPMVNPNAVYAMQQPYQNRAMVIPQNVYQQIQQPTHEDNQQSIAGDDTHERNESPGFKPNISMHQSAGSYHPMQQAPQHQMFNYGQIFSTAGRPVYPAYNIYPQRAPFPRYPTNKMGFNRPSNRKYNRYFRNDNHSNVKLHNLQTGYGHVKDT